MGRHSRRIERSQRRMLLDSVPSSCIDGLIRKKSHGSEEFLRFYDYQLEYLQCLPKGTIWRKDPVTFRGASHPMYARPGAQRRQHEAELASSAFLKFAFRVAGAGNPESLDRLERAA